ncbi:YkgJ family cysteine cluster protein [Floridanema aerugineum]|uniref:YkgJ family cysteine cluster protein n=1 Tax=Floridaenema aerugineum BLCC-F46 TaxID=3153654 RepID=A0ABV4XA23_9CYAN
MERKRVVKTVKSGEIRAEVGADGLHIVFDCDCLDANNICKSNCCSMPGINVTAEEFHRISAINPKFIFFNELSEEYEMQRESDGYCAALNRETGLCSIYDSRPKVCQVFHCSRGLQRGWKPVISRVVF